MEQQQFYKNNRLNGDSKNGDNQFFHSKLNNSFSTKTKQSNNIESILSEFETLSYKAQNTINKQLDMDEDFFLDNTKDNEKKEVLKMYVFI